MFHGHGKILWVNLWVWKVYGKILLGMWCWFLENLCGYDFGYVRIYLFMGMNLWEIPYVEFFFFFTWLWKNLVVLYGYVKNFNCIEILLGHLFDLIFCCGGHCLWEFFFFFFFLEIFGHGHGNWWAELLCCRASRVEVVSKCWKVHGHHCLLASKISSMKRALALSLKLCPIMRHMSIEVFSYFLPWQSASGTLPVPSIFQALGRWCWHLMTFLLSVV